MANGSGTDTSCDRTDRQSFAGNRRAGTTLAHFAGGLLDAVFPPVCLSCREPVADPDAVCTACWSRINFIRQPLCDRLGIPLRYDTRSQAGDDTPLLSAAATADPPNWDRARAVATFGDVMRRMVHALKYHDRHDARRLFGRWLTSAGADLLPGTDLIVPMPLHGMRLLARRFNQSALIAAEVSRLSGITMAPGALLRIKSTPSQVGLSPSERQRNVAGAFKVAALQKHRIAGKRVLLIDDVITTGATCRAATSALRRAGAVHVDVLALALATDTT